MTTLTVTPNPATGSHQLSIVPTGDVTRIQRTDANGTYDVRTLTGQLPHPVASGTLVVDDYEPANGTSTYTVTTAADVVAQAGVLALGNPWLSVPVTPQFSAQISGGIGGYGSGFESRSTVVEPDGSPFPIVIHRVASSRRGSLDLWGGSYADAVNLLRLCGRRGTYMLRQSEHTGMDMFFVIRDCSLRTLVVDGAASKFGVTVQYLEVPRPGGPLSGALGWTWGELKNTYATWGDVFNAFATWGDVRTNQEI